MLCEPKAVVLDVRLRETFVAGVGDDRDAVDVSVRQPGSHHLVTVAVLLWVRCEVRGDGHRAAVACFPYPSDTVAESASAACALRLDVSQLEAQRNENATTANSSAP